MKTHTDRSFFLLITIAMTALAFIGFGPSYYLKVPFGSRPLNSLLHIHGAACTAWLMLVLLQAVLIRGRQIALHRTLGMAGVATAAVIVVSGMMAVFDKPNATVTARAMAFLAIQSLVLFAGFVAAAIHYRGDSATHKRLIAIATIFLLPPAIGRLMVMYGFRPFPDYPMLTRYVALAPFIVSLAAYDLASRGRLHSATIAGAAIHVLQHPLFLWVGYTHGWQAVVSSL